MLFIRNIVDIYYVKGLSVIKYYINSKVSRSLIIYTFSIFIELFQFFKQKLPEHTSK